MNHYRKQIIAAAFLLLLGVFGCQPQSKTPTSRELANQEWNSARARVLISLANEQYKSGSFEKCRKTIAEAIKLSENDPALHILIAKLDIEQGQFESAERELAMVRKLAPNEAEAWYLSGVIYQRWRKPDLAREYYSEASARSPAELAYVLAEAEMLVALDRSPDALELLLKKIAYFEHSGAIRDAAAQLLMQSDRISDAIAVFREAVILSEDDPGIRRRLAMALFVHHEYADCASILSRLLDDPACAGRGELLLALGRCQLQLNQPRDARDTLTRLSQLQPNNAIAWRELGEASLKCTDLQQAGIALTHSSAIDARDPQTQILLGYVRLRESRFADAHQAFADAVSQGKPDVTALCLLGYCSQMMGNTDDAVASYAQALALEPKDEFATALMAGVKMHDIKSGASTSERHE